MKEFGLWIPASAGMTLGAIGTAVRMGGSGLKAFDPGCILLARWAVLFSAGRTGPGFSCHYPFSQNQGSPTCLKIRAFRFFLIGEDPLAFGEGPSCGLG